MNKALSSLCAIGMAVIPIFAHHGPINEDHDRTSAIKPEVLRANQGSESDRRILADLTAKAVDAVYNKGDRELMNKYFHPKFQLFLKKGSDLAIWDLDSFLMNTEKIRKSEGKWPKGDVYVQVANIDIFGYAATVRYHFCKGNKHTCEDLLSFYKFKDGWRIVSETSFHVGLD